VRKFYIRYGVGVNRFIPTLPAVLYAAARKKKNGASQ
jgi:hypothetical protein